MIRRRDFLATIAGAAGASAAWPPAARAQTYPTHPVTIMVGYPPGGPTDTIARVLAQRMSRPLGQSVIIENVSGANGSIAVGRAARAAPDGYTLSLSNWNNAVANGAVYALKYDLVADFTPVALLTSAALDPLAPDLPGEQPYGSDRLAKGEPGLGIRRNGGRRQRGARLRPLLPGQDCDELSIYPLSRRRSGLPRPPGRAGRPDVRRGVGNAALCAWRQAQGLCGARRDALVRYARYSDDRRSRRAGAPYLILARPMGAERHTVGRDRAA